MLIVTHARKMEEMFLQSFFKACLAKGTQLTYFHLTTFVLATTFLPSFHQMTLQEATRYILSYILVSDRDLKTYEMITGTMIILTLPINL